MKIFMSFIALALTINVVATEISVHRILPSIERINSTTVKATPQLIVGLYEGEIANIQSRLFEGENSPEISKPGQALSDCFQKVSDNSIDLEVLNRVSKIPLNEDFKLSERDEITFNTQKDIYLRDIHIVCRNEISTIKPILKKLGLKSKKEQEVAVVLILFYGAM